MTAHLGYPKSEPSEEPRGNARNGRSKKNVRTSAGTVELDIPRDRNAEFDPKIVAKHQRDITGIEDKVISLSFHSLVLLKFTCFFLYKAVLLPNGTEGLSISCNFVY